MIRMTLFLTSLHNMNVDTTIHLSSLPIMVMTHIHLTTHNGLQKVNMKLTKLLSMTTSLECSLSLRHHQSQPLLLKLNLSQLPYFQ